ncbi:MAG: hypothetical protein ACOCZ5_02180 [bacterium]
MNSKGNVFANNTIFVLTSIFGVGLIMLLVVNPAIHAFVKPALLATTTGEMNEMLTAKYNFVLGFVDILPYILFFIGIIYLLVIIFRKERTEYYG